MNRFMNFPIAALLFLFFWPAGQQKLLNFKLILFPGINFMTSFAIDNN